MTSTPNNHVPRRRTAALAIAAGLIGGGAIGFAATVPGSLSAASPETTAAPDNAGDENGQATPSSDRPDHAERLREELQPLVDDGTIGADQADAVAEHLASAHPGPRGLQGKGKRPGGAEMKANADEFAKVLGLADAAELREELGAGKSIAQIAEENGVAVSTVKQHMLDQLDERLDAAVADGKLDRATADEKRAMAEEMIDEKINSTDGRFGRRGPGRWSGRDDDSGANGGDSDAEGPNIVEGASA